MHHARDHGEGGQFQEAAIELANELEVSEDYERAYEGLPSWITDSSLHLLHRDGRPINGRLPCPRGCHWKRRPSRPILRTDCKLRAKLDRLVLLERKRRLALEKFWTGIKQNKVRCCGTMRDCPLK
ncbi:MAG: E2 domain-associated cysteine-rich protein [Asticcacaulis sp.]|uniref:E2 domain-associated cysteine-rich protein n=1 Tax=Asticcacaulis sp. TaxID=1872648 RepID=UPI003F7C97FA